MGARTYAFGLWAIMHRGGDPFGAPTRPPRDPLDVISGLGAHGVGAFELHAEDLIPWGSSVQERRRLLQQARRRMEDGGIVCAACGSDMFTDPLFADGGFTSHDARVRALAFDRYTAAMEVGAELGAPLFNIWFGRDGAEVDAARSPLDALQRLREGCNALVEHLTQQHPAMRLSIEPKPNEPRGDLYLPTVGHALAFIATLDHPERVGVVPEVAHAALAGLHPAHEVAHALDADKLFGIHLNAQRPLRFDQDLRFGAAGIKDSFFVVKLLEDARWPGPRTFDAHPSRTTDGEGVWTFVEGCIRTYEILADKVRQFNADPEVQELLAAIAARAQAPTPGAPEAAASGARALPYERLDHLVFEILTGTRR